MRSPPTALTPLTLLTLLGLSACLVLAPACGETTDDDAPTSNGGPPPFGTDADVERAGTLWTEIDGYSEWSPFPGQEGWQEGKSPHGQWLKYYVNDVAAKDPTALAHGSIVVKENYGEKDEGALGPVTVMKRIDGYEPAHYDWFWVKYDADGNVMENEAGVALAGRVAKGKAKGCIACHGGASGDDYVFANDG